MKVFLPFKRDKNSFLDEVENKFAGEFIYDDLNNHHNHVYDAIHIHWPEALTNYQPPSKESLDNIRNLLKTISKKAPIIYTVHNEIPHLAEGSEYNELYMIVENCCDAFLHYGSFTRNLLQAKYPSKKHHILRHPLYKSLPNNRNKEDARRTLNIPKDKQVILVFGDIRTAEEEEFINAVFKGVKNENKFLLATRWKNLNLRSKFKVVESLNFRSKKIRNLLVKDRLLINKFIEPENIQDYFNLADVVFIPRLKHLNSGIIYLGLTFHSPIVGPTEGNMGEILEMFNAYSYSSGDVKEASAALDKSLLQNFSKYKEELLQDFEPYSIAEEYLKIISSEIEQKNKA